MHVTLHHWQKGSGWQPKVPEPAVPADLLLVFGGAGTTDVSAPLAELRSAYPGAHLVGCSTAGEIVNAEVHEHTLVAAVMTFNATKIQGQHVWIADHGSSFDAGRQLASSLPAEGLRHVFVLSDGLRVNGSELAEGMTSILPPAVSVTGGLAGDGPDFGETQVRVNDLAEPGLVAAVGFYGERFRVGFGSLGGWDVFGPDRVVTRACGNVLYELDGQSALELYKTYLGDYARELPGSGLLFPLNIRVENSEDRVVRTILGISEKDQSLTFAGDIPVGSQAQLMRANFDRLVDGAIGAAAICQSNALPGSAWSLGLLISCVGRKMVLQQRVEEEVEGVREVLGAQVPLAGFYSYGELTPLNTGGACQLHNQTMTITTFAEA